MLVPILFKYVVYGTSKMLSEQFMSGCPHFHHGWRAFEGFDFVGEAAHVGVGRAFGLSPNGDVRKFSCSP